MLKVADEPMLIPQSGRKQSARRLIELALEIAPLLERLRSLIEALIAAVRSGHSA
jgi:hypothetical protein